MRTVKQLSINHKLPKPQPLKTIFSSYSHVKTQEIKAERKILLHEIFPEIQARRISRSSQRTKLPAQLLQKTTRPHGQNPGKARLSLLYRNQGFEQIQKILN